MITSSLIFKVGYPVFVGASHLEWALIENLTLPFFSVLFRFTGLTLGLPTLISSVTPLRIRVFASIIISLAISLALPIRVAQPWILSLGLDFMLGIAMGLVIRMMLVSAEMAGEIAGMQLGFGFSRTVDPLTQESSGPFSRLIAAASVVLIFVSEAHHTMLRGLAYSLKNVSAQAMLESSSLAESLVDVGQSMFRSGLRIAVPLVSVGFATNITFAFLTKVAPQVNLWALGFLVSVGVGMAALFLLIPSVVNEVIYLLERSFEQPLWEVLVGERHG